MHTRHNYDIKTPTIKLELVDNTHARSHMMPKEL
jgi:hypothetical protein